MLVSASQTQAMLFTPNQPQVHRSPMSGLQRPKSNLQLTVTKSISGAVNTQLTTVFKPNFEKPSSSPSTTQPPLMQLKMLTQPPQPVSKQTTQQLVFTEEKSALKTDVEELTSYSVSVYQI